MEYTYRVTLKHFATVIVNDECLQGVEIEHLQYQLNLGILKVKSVFIYGNIIKLELMQ